MTISSEVAVHQISFDTDYNRSNNTLTAKTSYIIFFAQVESKRLKFNFFKKSSFVIIKALPLNILLHGNVLSLIQFHPPCTHKTHTGRFKLTIF